MSYSMPLIGFSPSHATASGYRPPATAPPSVQALKAEFEDIWFREHQDDDDIDIDLPRDDFVKMVQEKDAEFQRALEEYVKERLDQARRA